MPDPRFYLLHEPATAGELARITGAALVDPALADRPITGVETLARAGPADLTFFADARRRMDLAATKAGACLLAETDAAQAPTSCAVLATPFPQAAFARAAARLHAPRLHAGALAIDPSAELEEDVVLAPGASVGEAAKIGRGTYIGPGAAVGPGVCIGRDCYLGANCVVGFTLIGDRVRIHAGAAVGEAGFGVAAGQRGLVDLPQLGRVIIQDGVTIGAGTCIDRGALEDTTIGENTKIDNQVQIAHNVAIGRNCILVAHTGVSGSVTIEDGCVLGGKAGLADHLTIGAGAQIAAGSGVSKDIPAGETWAGYPARPAAKWRREVAWLAIRAGERRAKGRAG